MYWTINYIHLCLFVDPSVEPLQTQLLMPRDRHDTPTARAQLWCCCSTCGKPIPKLELLGKTKSLSQNGLSWAERKGKKPNSLLLVSQRSCPSSMHTQALLRLQHLGLWPKNSYGSSASHCSGWDQPLETEGIPYPSHPPSWHAASPGCTPGKWLEEHAILPQ